MKIPILSTVVLLAACGAPDADVQDARATATSFLEAHAAGDGARACELIAPETRSQVEEQEQEPCAEAVLSADLPEPGAVQRTQVFSGEGVVVTDEQVVFVARFEPEGWRVTAAGCLPRGEKPHDCEVQGR